MVCGLEKKFALSVFIYFLKEFADAGSISGASHGVYVLLDFPKLTFVLYWKEE